MAEQTHSTPAQKQEEITLVRWVLDYIEEGRRSGGAMVEVEQSAKPLGFSNGPVLTNGSLVRERDYIIESLMITFVLMVGNILIERVAQGALAKQIKQTISHAAIESQYVALLRMTKSNVFILSVLGGSFLHTLD